MTEATAPIPDLNSKPLKDSDALWAYIGPMFIYTIIKRRDSASHVWHAKNGAALFVGGFALIVLFQILAWVTPNGLLAFFNLFYSLVMIVVGVVSLYAAWQAWNGKQWSIPVVSDLGQKIPLEKWFHAGTESTPTAPTTLAATPVMDTPAAVESPAVVEAPPVVEMPMPASTPSPVEMPSVTLPPEPMPVAQAPVAEAPLVAEQPVMEAPLVELPSEPEPLPEPSAVPAASPVSPEALNDSAPTTTPSPTVPPIV